MPEHASSFEHPTIFIAFSSDVGPFVRIVDQVVQDISNRAFVGRLKTYHWDTDPLSPGWGVEKTWQADIVGPQKRNCKATVVLFGERIGYALPDDAFAREGLALLSPVARDLGLRLKVGEARGRDELPLTGTTYELLSSILADRPTYIFAHGDRSVLDHRAPLDRRRFGFDRRKGAIGADRAALTDYAYQKTKLARLVDALGASSRPNVRNFVDGAQLSLALNETIAAAYQISTRPRREIFRGLDDYGVEDHDIYFGRHDAARRLIERFEAAERNKRPALMVLHGPPGDGKSSLAKAGVAGGLVNLAKLNPERLFLACAFDADIINACSSEGEAFAAALAAIWGDQPAPGALRREEFIAAVRTKLSANAPGATLVLVVDQFEKALALDGARFYAIWPNLLDALRELASSSEARVIFTHPSGPKQRTEEYDRWDDLRRERTRLVDAPPWNVDVVLTARAEYQFIPREALAGMFAAGRIPIDPALLDDIGDRYVREFNGDLAGTLGYLSAFCEALADIQDGREQEAAAKGRLIWLENERFPRSAITTRDIASLSFTGVIDDLAERGIAAFLERSSLRENEAERMLPKSLDQLLSQLVRIDPARADDASRLGPRLERVLPSIRQPGDVQVRLLAECLRERRLLRQRTPTTIQLVHDVVLDAWVRGRDWFAGQEQNLVRRARLSNHLAAHRADPKVILKDKALLNAAEDLLQSSVAAAMPKQDIHFLEQSLAAAFWQRVQEHGLGSVLLRALASPRSRLATLYLDAAKRWAAGADASDRQRFVHDLNGWWGEARAPLSHYAAWAGFGDALGLLLELGADRLGRSDFGASLLHILAETDLVEITSQILEAEGPNAPVALALKDGREATPLHRACAWGRLRIVRLFLDHGARADALDKGRSSPVHALATFARQNGAKDTKAIAALLADAAPTSPETPIGWRENDFGWSPLCSAAGSGDEGVIEMLLKDVPVTTLPIVAKWGSSPLHLAARNGHDQALSALIAWANRESSILDALDDDRRTPLHQAALKGSSNVVMLLLDAGANPSLADSFGQSPIEIAAQRGALDAATLLSKHKDVPSVQKLRALQQACARGARQLSRELIKELKGFSASEADYSLAVPPPAHAAVLAGDAETLELLLNNGLEVDSRDKFRLTPLHLAARRGRYDIAKMLLSEGARLNARSFDERTPLHEAAFRGEIPTLLTLLRRAPPDAINAIDRYNKTVLHALFQGVAERQDDGGDEDELMEAWQAIVEAGVDPLAVDLAGRTAFFLGARQLGPAIMAFADNFPRALEWPNKNGEFPVHNAAYHNNLETFRFIVGKLPLQLSVKAKDGPHAEWTPLHSAAAGGSAAIIEALLNEHVSLDATARGLTPIMIAASRRQSQIVRLLADRGADLALTDGEGRNVLHWAGRAGDADAFDFLKSRAHELLQQADKFGRKPTYTDFNLDFSDLVALRPYLEGGGDPNRIVFDRERDTTLTHRVAEIGAAGDMETIIDFGGDLRRKDAFGKNAIMRAIDKPNRATFEHLAKAGPVESLFDTASNGATLLHRAAKSGLDYAIPILVNRGVPTMQRDLERRIPLHLAATAGHATCVDMFLKIMRSEDVDALDLLTGRTALHKAIAHKRLECVRLLLDAGAQAGRRDFQGQSGFNLAEAEDDDDMRSIRALLETRRGAIGRVLRSFGKKT